MDTYYFYDGVVSFFEPGNCEDMARSMVELALDADKRDRLVRNAYRYVMGHSWEEKSRQYLALLDWVCGEERGGEMGEDRGRGGRWLLHSLPQVASSA